MKHILLSLCLLLTGCSQNWVSSNKPAGALDKDMEACREYAFKKFQPILLPNNEDNIHISGPKGSFINPYGGLDFKDVTRDSRKQAFQKCMQKSGWHLKQPKD
jgi:hypothetical protein